MALDASSRLIYYDAAYNPLKLVRGPDITFERAGEAWELDGSLYRSRIINQPVIQPSVDGDGFPAPHVMVEPAIEAQVQDPAGSFAAGGEWTHGSGISDSDPAESLFAGHAARRLAQNGAANPYIYQDIGVFSAGTEILHDIAARQDEDQHQAGIWDLTTGGWVVRYQVDMDDGLVTITDGAGVGTSRQLMDVGPNGGVVWEVLIRYDAAAITGNSRRIYWYPTTSGPNPGAMVLHYVNVYEGTQPAIVISSVGGVTKPKDKMWAPLGWNPQPHAGVLDFVQGDIDLATNQNFHLALGNGASQHRMQIFTDHGSSQLRILEQSQVVETRGAEHNGYVAKYGSRVRVVWRSTASDLYAAFYVDGASLGTDSNTTDLTYDAWPVDPHITFGAIDKNMSLPGRTGIQRLAIVKEADLDAAAGVGQDFIDEIVGYRLDPDGRLVS